MDRKMTEIANNLPTIANKKPEIAKKTERKDRMPVICKKADEFLAKSKQNNNFSFAAMTKYCGYDWPQDCVDDAMRGDRGAKYICGIAQEYYEPFLTTNLYAGASTALNFLGWKTASKATVSADITAISVDIKLSSDIEDLTKVLAPKVKADVV